MLEEDKTICNCDGNESLKVSTTRGVIWSAIDKIIVQVGQFVIGISLARMLMPEDFGLIGMLSIFIVLSQSFVDSGMGAGLIQKKESSSVDFSTVFIFNISISILLYGILFFCAPLIAEFFNRPTLTILTRILTINIIINSLTIVQRTKLIILIDFKTIAKINVVSILLSGLIAVYLAYKGWGVWALVCQNLLNSMFSATMFWLLKNWVPSIKFSIESFKSLFGFGYKLLLSGIYAQILNESFNVAIGKFYSAVDLGYFANSRKLAEVSSGSITNVLHQVTFPILSSLQDDRQRLVSVYRRIIRMTAFLIFPGMTLFSLLADPFIRLLLTDKWIPSIVLLQWMCFARIVTPISVINMSILNAVGRSDLFLKVDISKLPLIVLAFVITIPLGINAVVIGHVITSGIAFFINAYMPGKIFGYGALKQIRDIMSIIIATLIMAIFILGFNYFFENLWFQLISGITCGLSIYILSAKILQIEELNEIKTLLTNLIR